jgi:outer membrane protein OmpA-like peptidoglycan-associated protein
MIDHQLEWEEYDALYVGESLWQSVTPSTEIQESEFPNAAFEVTSAGESPFQLANSRENAYEIPAAAGSSEFRGLSGPESLSESESSFAGKAFEANPYSGEHLESQEIPQVLQGIPASLALHQLVNSPEMQQVSLASLLGKGARQTVRVDGADISVPSYLRLISRLSGEVAEQSEAETVPGSQDVTCITPVAVIAGYSEYSQQLNAAQQATLTRLAQEIVDSFATDTPIRLVRVVGHADTALRIPPAQRPKFEFDVSVRRAQSAEHDLRLEIERLGKGKSPEPIKLITFLPSAAMGSTKKFVSHPTNEAQMRMNRRVEIYFSQCTVPTSWTWVDSATRGLAIVPPDTDRRKRVRCMLSLVLKLREKASDGYLDYQNWKGLFFPPGFTEEQKEKLLQGAITHLERQLGTRTVYGPATEVTDNDFISALESVDEVITRSMRDFKLNAEAGGMGASAVVVRGWKLIQENRLNPNSIYSCYASYTW